MQVTATDRVELTRDMYAFASHMMRAANVGTFKAIAELDLSFTQIKALCAVEAEDRALSLGELAEGLGVSLGAMSRAVDGLYERGLVERDEDREDRRIKRVALTDSGHSVPRALNEARLSALSELIESLAEEEAQALGDALRMILDRREDIAAKRPPQKGSNP
jgi:DNA-binding MarR family transcriptional regulator